jgi:hypothetical protein
LLQLLLESVEHRFEVGFGHLVGVDDVVVAVLADGAAEADAAGAVFAEPEDFLKAVVRAPGELVRGQVQA